MDRKDPNCDCFVADQANRIAVTGVRGFHESCTQGGPEPRRTVERNRSQGQISWGVVAQTLLGCRLQIRVQGYDAAGDENCSFPGFTAALLDDELMLARANIHTRWRIADKLAIDFDVCA